MKKIKERGKLLVLSILSLPDTPSPDATILRTNIFLFNKN